MTAHRNIYKVDKFELLLARQTNGTGKHNLSNSLFF